MIAPTFRLRRHAEYQLVYKASRKQFARQASYFFMLRPPAADSTPTHATAPEGPRIGLTVPKTIGKAVDRNRIKRRMREAVRSQLNLLNAPVDLVLHPKRSVIDLDFVTLQASVAEVFRKVQQAAARRHGLTPQDLTQHDLTQPAD
jgi:ribonuclease P protein component